MQPFQSYQLYVALKQHFTSSYDFFKYGGKIRAKESAFEKRNDRSYFYKLSKHKDPQGLLVSTHVRHGDLWIGDVLHNKEVAQSYALMKKVQEAFTYHFKEDIGNLPSVFASLVVKDGQHPELLRRVLSRETNIETMIALNDVLRFVPGWNKEISDPVIWPQVRFTCLKYKPFLKYDVALLQNYLKESVL